MRESGTWRNLRNKAKGMWIARRIESSDTEPGISDVSFSINAHMVRGWMELKYVSKYPARETTRIVIDHFTNEQKLFLWKEGNNAGYAFLFVQLANDYYLFDHIAAQDVGNLTRYQMEERSIGFWKRTLIAGELMVCLATLVTLEDGRRVQHA